MGRPYKCPYCGLTDTVSKGHRKTKTVGLRSIRRCRSCHRKFTPKNQRPDADEAAQPQPHVTEAPGQVTGWMRFAGLPEKVTFDLAGNFHRDIRGAKIHFTGDGSEDDPQAAGYMGGFATEQTGETGDITAGLPPYDYGRTRFTIAHRCTSAQNQGGARRTS